MASTNKTPNYELPQYIGTDKPAWIADINDAMLKIDTGINTAQTGTTDLQTQIDGLSTELNTTNTTVDNLSSTVATQGVTLGTHTSQISTLTTGLNTQTGRIDTLDTRADGVDAKLGDTDISTIGDGSITGAISALNVTANITLTKLWSGPYNVAQTTRTIALSEPFTDYKLLLFKTRSNTTANSTFITTALPIVGEVTVCTASTGVVRLRNLTYTTSTNILISGGYLFQTYNTTTSDDTQAIVYEIWGIR